MNTEHTSNGRAVYRLTFSIPVNMDAVEVISILRKRSAQKRSATVESIDASDDRVVDRASLGDGVGRLIDIKVDLKIALCNLTPKQREICDLLLRDAVTPVARELGMPRSTLRDAIVKIREVFHDAGLEEYL